MKMELWQCAGWSSELTAGAVGRKLLGRGVVLFRDDKGVAHALGARCPHRGADLAKGSVIDGCIQCPFHGWRFNGGGRCVRVPSQPPGVKISPLATVPSFPLRELRGVLWIWMGTGSPQHCEPAGDPLRPPEGFVRRLFLEPQILDAPLATVVESTFDKAHVPFIHTGTFGPNQDPVVTRQRVTVDADGHGLKAEDNAHSPWRAEPKQPRGWLGLVGRLLGLRKPVAQHATFHVERGVQIYMEYPDKTYDLFVTRITPADEAHTWLFVESVRTRAQHAIGDWIQRRVVRRVFEEGKQETSLILPSSAEEPLPALSVESDRVGLAARRLYEEWARN